MKIIYWTLSILFVTVCCMDSYGQDTEELSQQLTINTFIEGTLLTPSTDDNIPLAIIIPDTGPTDRDGNQNFQKSYSLKKIAESLLDQNIASFRYDKRVLKQLRKGFVDSKISFDDFVKDAIDVVNYFNKPGKFSGIYIIGHGQGSLVGMLASKEKVDGFISLSGSGKTIDRVIIDQISQMDNALIKDTEAAFSEMRSGRITRNYPIALESIFNSDTQPFIMSWMQYDPVEEIGNLTIPTLIISGTKDLQVSVEEAKALKDKAPNGSLKLIDKMNHVLFVIQGDELENSKSYNESFRPIAPELGIHITDFIRSE